MRNVFIFDQAMKSKLILKRLILMFLAIFLSILVLLIFELIFRIKYLGYAEAMSGLSQRASQPSVLGTNNWVISDPDLNYRLNPAESTVNELSMKNPEISLPKPPGVFRIAVLGDSIPFSGDPSFVDLLRKKFSAIDKIEVINAGTPGYTTYQELVFLEKYLIQAEPDVVILSYCLNDNYKFLHRFDSEAKMLWTEEAETSLAINNSLDILINKSLFLATLKTQFDQKSTEKENSKFPWEETVDFNIAWKDYAWLDFFDNLNQIDATLKEHNGKLYVVTFPLGMQFNSGLLEKNYQITTKPQQKVAHYSEKLGVPQLDLLPVFYNYKQTGLELFTDGIHLDPIGAELAADSIYNFLLKDAEFRTKTGI